MQPNQRHSLLLINIVEREEVVCLVDFDGVDGGVGADLCDDFVDSCRCKSAWLLDVETVDDSVGICLLVVAGVNEATLRST